VLFKEYMWEKKCCLNSGFQLFIIFIVITFKSKKNSFKSRFSVILIMKALYSRNSDKTYNKYNNKL